MKLRRRQRAGKSELRWDTLDAVRGVDVLDQRDLEAGGGALAGDDGGVGEEEFPDLHGTESVQRERGIGEKRKGSSVITRNQRFPYLASTLSLFAIQFRYHLHSVAE